MKYIKGPLNYAGNKYRLLNQIFDIMKDDCNIFVDLFCGSGAIGLNYPNAKEIYLIDTNIYVISLLKYISKQNLEIFIEKLNKLIEHYKLTNTYKYGYDKYNLLKTTNDNNGYKELNLKGYKLLRDDFNKNSEIINDNQLDLLYLLITYGFNNGIRFNSKGKYNMPIGKSDFNKTTVNKLKDFINQSNENKVNFVNLS